MRKYILTLLYLLANVYTVFADIADHGRPWDVPGYHGGSSYRWITLLIILGLLWISHKEENH